MNTCRWLTSACCLVFATLAIGEDTTAAGFTTAPAATTDADGRARITFTVNKVTDLAVDVEDATGTIVRHLAAGVLGDTPPPPLNPGLAQVLTWDGKDDYGKPVAKGEFTVRVSLGLKPAFDGFLLHNKNAAGPIGMLAVGPAGSVYLFHHDATALPSHWGSAKIKIINRDGEHLRALTPFPADINPQRVASLNILQDEDGAIVPRIHHLRRLSFYPLEAHSFPKYCSPIVDPGGRVYWIVNGPAIACLDADGGIPPEGMIGPLLLKDVEDLHLRNRYTASRDAPTLALSGDGKSIYMAGLGTGKYGKDEPYASLPCVFRVDAATRDNATVFAGTLGAPGKERGALTAPRGLAVANGLLYVADTMADRVVVFKESDGSFMGEIKVSAPHSLGADPSSGAVYVCAYTGKQTADLIKFDGYNNAREVCRIALPKTNLNPNNGVHRIAVDPASKPTRIWLPDIPGGRPSSPLRYYEDAGDTFADKGDPRDLETPWAEGPRDLSLDRKRGDLYVKESHQKWFCIEEKTGKTKDVFSLAKSYKYNLTSSANGTQIVVAPDGNIISLNWSKGLVYLDRKTAQPINWPGQESDCIPYGGLMNFMERVLAVTDNNEIFVVLPNKYRLSEADAKASKSRVHSVDVLGFDGNPKRTAIWSCTHGAVMKLDHKGNIYLGEPVRPEGRWYPEFFDGKLDAPMRNLTPGEGREVFWNSYMYGSIVKFPPSGGAIWYLDGPYGKQPSPSAIGKPSEELLAKPVVKGQAHIVYGHKIPAEIQGAEWSRFGFSPYSVHSGSDTCMCEGAGFDVDLHGRVFYPNLGQFRIEVVDAANNMIGTFGKYGNQDSGGPDAQVKTPHIPLAWPISVVASDTHAYVADTINRRLVKVKLDYDTTAICKIGE